MTRTNAWADLATEDDFQSLKERTVPGKTKIPSYGARNDLEDHLDMLSQEFAGEPLILFYHAVLTVHIRRKIDLDINIGRFHELWREQKSYLAAKLDSRWLVSACDTFMDYGTDQLQRTLALCGSLFANTLKIYETERWALGMNGHIQTYRQITSRIELFDGMTAFVIGEGNMLQNLHTRVSKVAHDDNACACILRELVRRASLSDTAFHRFRQAHKNSSTAWSLS